MTLNRPICKLLTVHYIVGRIIPYVAAGSLWYYGICCMFGIIWYMEHKQHWTDTRCTERILIDQQWSSATGLGRLVCPNSNCRNRDLILRCGMRISFQRYSASACCGAYVLFLLKQDCWVPFSFSFYSAPQCSHCKRCTSYGNSVCLSVRPSVRLSITRRYCVKTTARSKVQFAPLESKMCLVL